jgi:hypothetical protein
MEVWCDGLAYGDVVGFDGFVNVQASRVPLAVVVFKFVVKYSLPSSLFG